eukprot:127920-Hanusia_phi.AAC.1
MLAEEGSLATQYKFISTAEDSIPSHQTKALLLRMRGGDSSLQFRGIDLSSCQPDTYQKDQKEHGGIKQKSYDVGFLQNGPPKPAARRSSSYCDYTRILSDNQNVSREIKLAESYSSHLVDSGFDKKAGSLSL